MRLALFPVLLWGLVDLTLLADTARAHGDPLPAALRRHAPEAVQAARAQVVRDAPILRQVIQRGGAFGSEFSQVIANRMYSRTDLAAIDDARAKLKVESHGPRSWLLRLPFVNVAVFDTDEGLVLVDSGYAPAGPVLRETLERLSPKPVHTIIHTHFHPDHAWGAWTLLDKGPNGSRPRIVTTDAFVDQVKQDLRSHGFVQRVNQQVVVPRQWADVLAPTLTIQGRTTLQIGGEAFVLHPARGETEDQLWVSVPSRRIVVSADYYQDFMPNAGNGRRRQRFVDDWAQALKDMAALNPERVLPMHGPSIVGESTVQDRLRAHASALQILADQAIEGVNAGLRPDQIVQRAALPGDLAKREDLRPHYTSAKDIARMVTRQFTGWYDGIPSNWNPAPLADQARAIAALAGGARGLIGRARSMAASEPAVAASLADWAWLAAPEDREVLQGAYDIYRQRAREDTTTQEALAYLEHLVMLRLALDAPAAKAP